MIQRATLEVLAEAAEIGLPETATVPASSFDPFLRPAIVRRVRAAVASAEERVAASLPGDHVLRLAFVLACPGAPGDLDPNDQLAVRKAYDSLVVPYLPKAPPPKPAAPGGAYRAAADREPASVPIPTKRPKRFWPMTTALVALIVLSIAGGLGVFFAPLIIPTPIARFRSTQLGTVLAQPLTDFVADGDANILSVGLKREIGDAAFDDFGRLLREVPPARSHGGTTDEAMAGVFAAVNDLNRDLASAKIPALLHAYAQGGGRSGERAVWLTSYYVTRRSEITSGDRAVKVAWGHRLDSLNLADSIVYKADAEDWAILSMDRIEQDFVQGFLAPIVLGTPMGPTEYESSDKSPMAELARAAAPVIVKELLDASRIDRGDAEALHRALIQRNELVVSLSKVGYAFKPSSSLELSPATLRGLARGKGSNPEDAALLDDFVRLGKRTASYRKAITPATALLAQIEEERFVMRLAEAKRLADVPADRLKALGRAAQYPRSRAIASADLALLAREEKVPRVALWRLGQRVLGDVEDEGTVAILSAVLKELGLLDAADPTLAVDRVFVRNFQKAFELPPAQVRAAAARAYAAIFGGPPPALARKTLP